MVVSISDIPKNTNVYRFITSGKPGKCKLCNGFVEKLEAHHLCYSPEIIIKICHNCHHRVHFWPQRLSDQEKYKLLSIRYDHKTAGKLTQKGFLGMDALSAAIAPSRKVFKLKHLSKSKVKKQKFS